MGTAEKQRRDEAVMQSYFKKTHIVRGREDNEQMMQKVYPFDWGHKSLSSSLDEESHLYCKNK